MNDSPTVSLLDAITLAGNRTRPNDDRWGAAANRVWVIDGATGLGDPLMPGLSDAAWFAQRANEAFHRHAAIIDTRKLMAAVADDLAAAFHAERKRPPAADWETPCGSFLMATLRPGSIELTGLGDCRGLVAFGNGRLEVFGASAESEAREAAFAAQYRQTGETPRYRSHEALEALREARSRFAMADGEFILVPDRLFLPAIRPVEFATSGSTTVLLMTDGFAALGLRYGAIADAEMLELAERNGLAPLAERLREIEVIEDPDGVQFPRWKRSDDATAVLFAVG
jgi:hypothetical protein